MKVASVARIPLMYQNLIDVIVKLWDISTIIFAVQVHSRRNFIVDAWAYQFDNDSRQHF